MREQIMIAAKIYKCHDSMKNLFKDEYEEKIYWYVSALRKVMEVESLDVLKAVLFVSKMDSVKDNEMAIILFMAAAVEIIESKPKRGGQHTNSVILSTNKINL